MAKKSMFTNGRDNSDFAGRIHSLADEMGTDFSDHAKKLREVANGLYGPDGKQNVKEHRTNQGGPGHKKTSVAKGG